MPTRTKSTRKSAILRNPRQSERTRNRIKLSTTVAAENFTFLENLVHTGRTDSIAEAVDLAIARLRRVENRALLEAATAAYFDGLSPEAQREEQTLGRQLHLSARGVDFDREP
jgi:ribosomal protein L17